MKVMRVSTEKTLLLAMLTLAAAFPFLAEATGNQYLVSSASRVLIFAIAAISLDLILGYGGLVSLGHAAYLGVGAYGVAAAAQSYWDKALNELTLADCSYLATLPKAPSNYDPFRYHDRAVARRNWVIDRVVENGFATKEEGEAAKAQPLGVIKRQTGPKIFASEYFAEEVRREILDRFGEDKLYGGGLSVRTTLDRGCSASPGKRWSTALLLLTAGAAAGADR